MIRLLSIFALLATLAVAQNNLVNPVATPTVSGTPVGDLQHISSGGQAGNTNQGIAVAVNGNDMIVVFPEQVSPGGIGNEGTMDIWARISNDGGATWLPAQRVCGDAPHSAASQLPQAAIGRDPSGAPVYFVVWEDARLHVTPTGTGARDDVFGAFSIGGAPFMEVSIAGNPMGCMNNGCGSSMREIDELTIAAEGSLVCVIWEEDGVNPGCSGGNEAVYANTSNDGGLTWTGPVQVSNNFTVPQACLSTDTDNTTLAIVDGIIYAAYHHDDNGDNNVELATSTDGGLTWTTIQPELQTGDNAGFSSATVSICVNNTVVGAPHIITLFYEDDFDLGQGTGVASITSFDGGLSWASEVQAFYPTNPGAGVEYHDAVADGANIYLCFCTDEDAAAPNNGGSSNLRELWFTQSSDNGQSYTPAFNMEPGQINNESQIAAFDGNIIIQVQDQPFGGNWLVHWVSTDNGATWTKYNDNTSNQTPDVDAAAQSDGRRIAVDPKTGRGCSAVRYNQPFGANESHVLSVSFPFTGTVSNQGGTAETVFVDGMGNLRGNVIAAGLALGDGGLLPSPLFLGGSPFNLVLTNLTFDTLAGGIFAPFFVVPTTNIGRGEAALPIPSVLLPLGVKGQAYVGYLDGMDIKYRFSHVIDF